MNDIITALERKVYMWEKLYKAEHLTTQRTIKKLQKEVRQLRSQLREAKEEG